MHYSSILKNIKRHNICSKDFRFSLLRSETNTNNFKSINSLINELVLISE